MTKHTRERTTGELVEIAKAGILHCDTVGFCNDGLKALDELSRRLESAEDVILDMWNQFVYRKADGTPFTGSLSALEYCEEYLRKNRLAEKAGLPPRKDEP